MCTVWFPLPHVTATIPDEEQAMSFAAPAADAIPLSIAVELARNQSVSALLPTPGLLGTAPVAVTVAVSNTHTTHTHTRALTHTPPTHTCVNTVMVLCIFLAPMQPAPIVPLPIPTPTPTATLPILVDTHLSHILNGMCVAMHKIRRSILI